MPGCRNRDDAPDALVADIPSYFPGFAPKNFDLSFSGLPASLHFRSRLIFRLSKCSRNTVPNYSLTFSGKQDLRLSPNQPITTDSLFSEEEKHLSLNSQESMPRCQERLKHIIQQKYFKDTYHPLRLTEINTDEPIKTKKMILRFQPRQYGLHMKP